MSMIKTIQKKTASSKEGAVGLLKGIIVCAFQNISFIIPVSLLYYLVADMMDGGVHGERIAFYVVGCVLCFALILITTWFQYNNTFFTTYEESGKRRLNLAERLRKLPLSFFGKRDLADLTSTIMDFNRSYFDRIVRFRMAYGSRRALGRSRVRSHRDIEL